MDDRLLPEVRHQPPDSAEREHSRRVHEALLAWTEIASARVVNRPAAMASNASKPYQAQLISDNGFEVPETLVTNDPQLVSEFPRRGMPDSPGAGEPPTFRPADLIGSGPKWRMENAGITQEFHS
jgi:hypothetical protein